MLLFFHDRINFPALSVQLCKQSFQIFVGKLTDSLPVLAVIALMTDCHLHMTVAGQHQLAVSNDLRCPWLILTIQRAFRRMEKDDLQSLSPHIVHGQIHCFFRTHDRHICAKHIYFSRRMFFHPYGPFQAFFLLSLSPLPSCTTEAGPRQNCRNPALMHPGCRAYIRTL